MESHVAARLNGYVGGYGRPADFDAEWEGMGLNERMADYVRKELVRAGRGVAC